MAETTEPTTCGCGDCWRDSAGVWHLGAYLAMCSEEDNALACEVLRSPGRCPNPACPTHWNERGELVPGPVAVPAEELAELWDDKARVDALGELVLALSPRAAAVVFGAIGDGDDERVPHLLRHKWLGGEWHRWTNIGTPDPWDIRAALDALRQKEADRE